MKKAIFIALFCSASLFLLSCGGNSKKSEGTHTHEDGSTHAAHSDTVKPAQQEFKTADTTGKTDTGAHMHKDGSKHTH